MGVVDDHALFFCIKCVRVLAGFCVFTYMQEKDFAEFKETL